MRFLLIPALAAALLAPRATAEAVARLTALVAAMDEARGAADTARFRALNAEFHAELVKATGNRRLLEVYEGLAKEMRLTRRRALASEQAMESSNREHRAIVAAIAARDEAGAATAMESHIVQGKERFLAAAADDLDE
jgi:DNA-binding GntR family transcriptional regulator